MHQNADCLSRLKIASISAIDSEELNIIRGEQEKDEFCRSVKHYLTEGTRENEEETPLWVKEIALFQIRNGILYREELPVVVLY